MESGIAREPDTTPARPSATWGQRLFYWAVVAALVFFWWLLVYDHGVGTAHGG